MSKLDWKEIVRTIAPTVAHALGGPLAGQAVQVLGDKLLGKPGATEQEVSAAILGATPEQLLKLREVELDFVKFMENAGIQREQIAAGDRDSARKRQMVTGDNTPQLLVIVALVGWIIIQVFLFSSEVPAGNREIIIRALGTLDALLGMGFTYFLGSSASSRAKDSTVAALAQRA